MAGRIKAAINKAIPWLLFGSVLIPAGLSAVVGVLVLVFWRRGGDIALGVLAITLGLSVLTGTIISLALLRRQNRMVRAQADLVAHVGHELKTPLASVMMGIETLKEGRFGSDSERLAFIDMVDRESNRLARLVEQAIGYQIAASRKRKDAGEAGGRVDAQPAGRVMADAMATWLTRPDTAGLIRFENTCLDTDLVTVDADGLEGAVANLVGNALTYGNVSEENPVTVKVGATGAAKAGSGRKGRDGWIVVEVVDRGPGVRKGDRKKIFERFQRGGGTSGNDTPGLGLGLAIVREFAACAGGRIEVADTPGGGATFTLTLPRTDGRGAEPGGTPATEVSDA